jgi:hypothetical protein
MFLLHWNSCRTYGVSLLQATEDQNSWVLKTLPFSMMHFMVLRNYNLCMLFPLIYDVGVCGVPIQILEVMFHWFIMFYQHKHFTQSASYIATFWNIIWPLTALLPYMTLHLMALVFFTHCVIIWPVWWCWWQGIKMCWDDTAAKGLLFILFC